MLVDKKLCLKELANEGHVRRTCSILEKEKF